MAITKVTNSVVGSGSATDGYVLTADGSGNSAWEEVAGGASSINDLTDAKTFGTGSIMLGDTTTGTLSNANYNVGVGVDMLNSLTSGYANIAIGFESCKDLTTGHNNVAVGHATLYENIGGEQNVAVGANALQNNTSGNYNTAVGKSALLANTTASYNTAVGHGALDANTTGEYSTAVGQNALGANTTGNFNVAVGRAALSSSNSDSNTAVGINSLSAVTSGTSNTGLGDSAGNQTSTGSNNTWLGANCKSTSAWGGASRLGANGFGVGIDVRSNYRVQIGYYTDYIYADYQSSATWNRISDERKKKNIENLEVGLDYINALRPVTYKWKAPSELPSNLEGYDPNNTTPPSPNKQVGLIAQEVKAVNDAHSLDFNLAWDKPDGFANENEDGLQALSYENLIMPLIKAIQELSSEVETLKSQIGN